MIPGKKIILMSSLITSIVIFIHASIACSYMGSGSRISNYSKLGENKAPHQVAIARLKKKEAEIWETQNLSACIQQTPVKRNNIEFPERLFYLCPRYNKHIDPRR